MSIKQISVFLENKPGQLQKMTAVLAAHNIDMRALSLVETKDFGIARLIVDDAMEAVTVLKDNDFIARLTSVLAVAVPDVPGGLDKLLQIFAAENINLEYMYAFLGSKDINQAYMIIRTSDTKAAETRLRRKALHLLSQEDIANI
ncbi:MAG: acetolactate synthase [bacterium]